MLSYCNLDDNDIICLGKALRKNLTLTSLDVYGNKISSHAFSELLWAIRYSAISSLFCNRPALFHLLMEFQINRNRHSVHIPPLRLKDGQTTNAQTKQCAKHVKSLPPDFLTGPYDLP